MTSDMEVLEHTAVIKVIPKEMNGKYKIGQNMSKKDKIDIANKILERNSSTARETLEIMGFGIEEGKAVLRQMKCGKLVPIFINISIQE